MLEKESGLLYDEDKYARGSELLQVRTAFRQLHCSAKTSRRVVHFYAGMQLTQKQTTVYHPPPNTHS